MFCTTTSYDVTPEIAFHVYAGESVATLPDGETAVGAGGSVGPVGIDTLNARPALKALEPDALVAFTDQLYDDPLLSVVAGVTEHVVAHAACAEV